MPQTLPMAEEPRHVTELRHAEHTLRVRQARVIRQSRKVFEYTADRIEAGTREVQARADLAREIADAIAELTPEQVEVLRPLLTEVFGPPVEAA